MYGCKGDFCVEDGATIVTGSFAHAVLLFLALSQLQKQDLLTSTDRDCDTSSVLIPQTDEGYLCAIAQSFKPSNSG